MSKKKTPEENEIECLRYFEGSVQIFNNLLEQARNAVLNKNNNSNDDNTGSSSSSN